MSFWLFEEKINSQGYLQIQLSYIIHYINDNVALTQWMLIAFFLFLWRQINNDMIYTTGGHLQYSINDSDKTDSDKLKKKEGRKNMNK